MLVIFAVLFGGIAAGRLLSGVCLGFLPRLITGIIWVLLFLLGLEVGANPDVVNGMATLGMSALVVCAFSLAGSIFASWLLWRRIRGGISLRGAASGTSTPQFLGQIPALPATLAPHLSADLAPARSSTQTACAAPVVPQASLFIPLFESAAPSMWTALRGSLVIVAFFVAGCIVGVRGLVAFDVAASGLSTYVLYALMCCVGITLGHDTSLVGQVRRLDQRLALLPLITAGGTLGGAVLAAWFARLNVADSLAVSAGFGYYSLSSIFIADLRGVELGAIALLCNVMREIFTLVAAPLVARWFGPLAAVSIGGATTFDTTLPIITQAAGRQYAVVAVFHGCLLDFSVPFLVTLFCAL